MISIFFFCTFFLSSVTNIVLRCGHLFQSEIELNLEELILNCEYNFDVCAEVNHSHTFNIESCILPEKLICRYQLNNH